MAYQRIKAFPEDAATFGSSELDALGKVWHEKKEELQGTGIFQDFLKNFSVNGPSKPASSNTYIPGIGVSPKS